MLKHVRIAAKKIRSIPKDQLLERVKLGVKKHLSDEPYSIIIQTVSACDLKCRHCFINDYGTHIPDGIVKIMQWNEFTRMAERLRPMLKRAAYVQLSTFEAILNKNLFAMFDALLAINPRLQFPFLSNAMQLTEEKIKQLEKYPLSIVNISLDGCTKKTVEDFKTDAVFEKIISAIQLLKKSKLKEKVTVTFVAHKNNVSELPRYVDFVNELGVKEIFVSNLLTFTSDFSGQELYSKNGNAEAQMLFDETVKRAKHNGQKISMPRLAPQQMGCQACESFFIDINGNVAPCDFLAVTTPFSLWGETKKHPPVIFGNILKDDPLKIYRNPAFKKFREAHQLGKNLPAQCTHCIDAYGMMCSNRINY
ncbi:MAG: radical SAM protein [Bacteroidetes bacterium]|nr:radical SAM protein [Bacteroidota bacterium]